jgi:hypothetical protein
MEKARCKIPFPLWQLSIPSVLKILSFLLTTNNFFPTIFILATFARKTKGGNTYFLFLASKKA